MGYSKNWLRFRKAEDEYFTCRYQFMQGAEAIVSDLKIALLSADGRLSALRLLVETKLEVAVIAPLLPMILDSAVDSSQLTAISLARDVLYNYKDEAKVKSVIHSVAANYLNGHDEWQYRRLAELYKLLGYEVEFTSLLSICRTSINPEIREISEDFDCVKKNY